MKCVANSSVAGKRNVWTVAVLQAVWRSTPSNFVACAVRGFMGRLVKQLVILFGETSEVPEAEVQRNLGYSGRAFAL